jgi:hypothetical protein
VAAVQEGQAKEDVVEAREGTAKQYKRRQESSVRSWQGRELAAHFVAT